MPDQLAHVPVPVPADRRLAPVIRLAPAKVNLTLAVLGRRPDGFHDLHSVMAPLGLADRLSLALATGSADTLAVTGFDAGPLDDNLVMRAVAEVRALLGRAVPTPPLAMRLEKHIPVAAGLAGGSSDAAAAIDGALEAWGADGALDPPALADLRRRAAARLGSDVPFFLAAGPALVSGRGEHVDPLPPLRGSSPGLLLITPDAPLSTPAVFAALDTDPAASRTDPGSTRASSEHLASEWRAGLRTDALVTRAGVLASANDLAGAADIVLPGLRNLRRALVRVLRRPVGLSGSGPSLWVLYASASEAEAAAEELRGAVVDGSIVAPGSGEPSIVATTIDAAATGSAPDGPEEGAA
jgi:4-diphosphocytidyl-2-C-methyl-D-erythritol kinase